MSASRATIMASACVGLASLEVASADKDIIADNNKLEDAATTPDRYKLATLVDGTLAGKCTDPLGKAALSKEAITDYEEPAHKAAIKLASVCFQNAFKQMHKDYSTVAEKLNGVTAHLVVSETILTLMNGKDSTFDATTGTVNNKSEDLKDAVIRVLKEDDGNEAKKIARIFASTEAEDMKEFDAKYDFHVTEATQDKNLLEGLKKVAQRDRSDKSSLWEKGHMACTTLNNYAALVPETHPGTKTPAVAPCDNTDCKALCDNAKLRNEAHTALVAWGKAFKDFKAWVDAVKAATSFKKTNVPADYTDEPAAKVALNKELTKAEIDALVAAVKDSEAFVTKEMLGMDGGGVTGGWANLLNVLKKQPLEKDLTGKDAKNK